MKYRNIKAGIPSAVRQVKNLTSHYARKIGPRAVVGYTAGTAALLTGGMAQYARNTMDRALRNTHPGMNPQESGIGTRVTPQGPGIAGVRFDFNRNRTR